MADHLDAVETNSERVILRSSLRDVATENARKMFYALTMLLQGPLLLLLKKVERGNGFEAWRLLVERLKKPAQADDIMCYSLSFARRRFRKTLEASKWL